MEPLVPQKGDSPWIENIEDQEMYRTRIECDATVVLNATDNNKCQEQGGCTNASGTTVSGNATCVIADETSANVMEDPTNGEDKMREEDGLEEGELPDSCDEDDLVNDETGHGNSSCDTNLTSDDVQDKCSAGDSRAVVSFKRMWSASSDQDFEIASDANKRRCLCCETGGSDGTHVQTENGLAQLCLEIVVPVTALFSLWRQRSERNQEALGDIESGQAFSQPGWWKWLIAGSRAEGLCVLDEWGQEPADQDTMDLHGGAWGVRVHDTDVEDDVGSLVMVKDGCPPAYSRVLVNGRTRPMAERMAKDTPSNDIRQMARCFVKEENGDKWLSSQTSIHVLTGRAVSDVDSTGSGPAVPAGTIEYVPALVASKPLPCFEGYFNRYRGSYWPRPATLERLRQLPAILVATGHKDSADWDLEWRDSWSIHELLLAQDMPHWVKQAFCGFKYAFKNHMNLLRLYKPASSEEGRSKLGSYCLKTLLLWELEQPEIWQNECGYHLFSLLLTRLLQHLEPIKNGEICVVPHYFIPECNLLERVTPDDLSLALDCVRQIQRDPLTALILMPKYPWHIYGGTVEDRADIDRLQALDQVAVQHAEDLLDAILCVRDAHDTAEFDSHLQRLIGLLERLDGMREEKYETQSFCDNYESWKKPVRLPLRNLVTLANNNLLR